MRPRHGAASTPAQSYLPVVLVFLLLYAPAPGHANALEVIVPLRTCNKALPQMKPVAQPFQLPKLRLQWDSWPTSKITTSLAALILSEKMGFDVELVERYGSRDVYPGMASGSVHLAFEAWPASNPETYAQFVDVEDPQVLGFPYSALFGRVGLYETCKRGVTCADAASETLPPLFRDAIKTEAGKKHFRGLAPHLEARTPPRMRGVLGLHIRTRIDIILTPENACEFFFVFF